MLALSSLDKIFGIKCDVSSVGMGSALTQEGKLLAFLNRKLCDSRQKYSTKDKEFYAIVYCLEHFSHYLVPSVFILHFYHEALKYNQGQHKSNSWHVKWVEYLQPNL